MNVQGFRTFKPGRVAMLALGVTGLVAACSATAPDAGVATSASAPTVATVTPANVPQTAGSPAAMRVYVDPKTGAFIDPPPEAATTTDSTATAVKSAAKEAVTTRKTASGYTVVTIPGAMQSVCASKPTADAPASQTTVSDCATSAQPKAENQIP